MLLLAYFWVRGALHELFDRHRFQDMEMKWRWSLCVEFPVQFFTLIPLFVFPAASIASLRWPEIDGCLGNRQKRVPSHDG